MTDVRARDIEDESRDMGVLAPVDILSIEPDLAIQELPGGVL